MPLSVLNRAGLASLHDAQSICCARGVADLEGETKPVTEQDSSGQPIIMSRSQSRQEVVNLQRRCAFFERHRPGVTVSGHLGLQHRRQEWRRTAIVALVAAIIGGLIATLPTMLFGQDVTIIIGR